MERVLQGRYKIEEPLGVGGSSQVYLARDQALNRDVALKVLDPAAAADGNLRRMFVKEARALAQLSHPNIVAVYDVGEVDDSPFIVMEYLPGGSMKQRIEQAGPLKTGDAVRIAIEVANGLAFAHSKGIIHADLKPANILFDANDTAKICDFGIAGGRGYAAALRDRDVRRARARRGKKRVGAVGRLRSRPRSLRGPCG
jgi:serine/threonine-protein kinase